MMSYRQFLLFQKKKERPKNSKPFMPSFLSSSVNVHSTSSLSLSQKIRNPPRHIQTSNLLHLQWHKLMVGKHILSKLKSPQLQRFSSIMEHSGSSVPRASLTSTSLCELLTGMVVTPSPSYYITPFIFGFLKSIDLESVGLNW